MAERETSHRITRRGALKVAGGAVAGSLIVKGSAGAQEASPAAAGFFPSPIEGVPNAYYEYPTPFTTVDSPPGKGGTVRLAHLSDKRINDRPDNQYWQELEARLGVTLDVTLLPGAAYAERMATMIAGGDFPDLLFVLDLLYPQASEFKIQGAFTDVTGYLDGDARQAFPNLAAMPSYAFENSKLNGVLYGVPSPTSLQPNALWYRGDWLTNAGLSAPANAAEFLNMINAFTTGDPDGNGNNDTYGTSFERLDAVSQRFIHSMFRVGAEGNGWIVNDDGSFTHSIETEEFRAALEYAREVWASGSCHPDSLTQTSNEVREQLMAGVAGSGPNAFILLNFIRGEAAKVNPDAQILGLAPPGHDGGEGVAYNIGGWFGQFAIPTSIGADEARMEELLGITNYFGAPFGSEEYNFLVYGIEGVHHTLNDDGSRTLTEAGERDVFNPSLGALNVLYSPNRDEIEYVQSLMAAQTRVGLFSPTVNLYAPAASEFAGELSQLYTDRKIDISTGRAGMEDLDTFISEYMSRGGDQIRTEFEEAYAEAQSQ